MPTAQREEAPMGEAMRRADIWIGHGYQLVRAGKIKARKVDGKWLVDVQSAIAWTQRKKQKKVAA